jgi:hypothetical protein
MNSCHATSAGRIFRGCSHSLIFRLLRSLGLQVAPTATPHGVGQPGRLHHAPPGGLPTPGCGIATCPTWAIDTAGLSPAGLQPRRLLISPHPRPQDLAEPQIQHVMQVDVAQQHADRSTLRHAAIFDLDVPLFQHPRS